MAIIDNDAPDAHADEPAANPVRFDQQWIDDVRSYRVVEHESPVTVDDLLDHLDAFQRGDDSYDQRAYNADLTRAERDVRASYHRIKYAFFDIRRLTDDERRTFEQRYLNP